jgi:hypothetical protein
MSSISARNEGAPDGGTQDESVAPDTVWLAKAGVRQHMNEHEPRSATGKPRRDDPLGTNSEIGRKLREYYDGLMSPEVPDRFTDLLSQLETAESQRKKAGDAE